MLDFLNRIQNRKRSSPFHSALPDLASADLNELRADVDYAEFRRAFQIGHQQADLSWKKKYYALRTIWATLSIALLGLSLWFTFWIVSGVGRGDLNFVEYKSFLNIIAGEILLNVLGLVAIVIHFLFPKDGDPKNGAKR